MTCGTYAPCTLAQLGAKLTWNTGLPKEADIRCLWSERREEEKTRKAGGEGEGNGEEEGEENKREGQEAEGKVEVGVITIN